MIRMPPRPRQGRPRHSETSGDASPREEILDAAAALFALNGFAATSTRTIAEKVGIRQASLYYHFANKDELLIELLSTSVMPSLDAAQRIEQFVADGASPAGALFCLATVDVLTLAATPYNIGTLYLLPEVQREPYEQFRVQRQRLQSAYGRLGQRAAHTTVRDVIDESRLGELLLQLTEVVIQIRRDRDPDDQDSIAIATSCLRLCGLSDAEIDAARIEADELRTRIEDM